MRNTQFGDGETCDNCLVHLADKVWQDHDGGLYCEDCAVELEIKKEPPRFTKQDFVDASYKGQVDKLCEIIEYLYEEVEELKR
ncbi:MAG: hypothetical protein PF569_08295 [Candidatus Woesearchaeota archaeon]|jgi:hypothetical protein|nr:hypothetical protein [Candidatus Woesearchaeota archaeon]